jgi:hypothetical protein
MRGLILSLLAAAFAFAVASSDGSAQPPKKEEFKKPDRKTVKALMEKKLLFSQKLLADLTTNKLEDAGKNAEELMKVRKQAAWMIVPTKEYQMWSEEFETSARNIQKAAKEKNLDTAKLAYLQMTLTCFHCHTYVRDLGDIGLPVGDE